MIMVGVLKLFSWVYDIAEVIFAEYMIMPFLMVVLYFIIRIFKLKSPFQKRNIVSKKDTEFGIIVTAYRDTKFILPLIDSVLRQKYQNFYLYVVADDCSEPINGIDDQRIHVLTPPQELGSKVKSIDFAIASFVQAHDAIVILDDNCLLHPQFLWVINQYFQKGYKVVQSAFKPKNSESSIARMDAIGDIYNFFMQKDMRMRLGLSSTIWGSGVAVDLPLYKGVIYTDFLGGFDKKLQAYLVMHTDKIAYACNAILYDEKVNNPHSLVNQRTRWISSYFKYFKESFLVFINGVRKFNFNLTFFGFYLLRPPLFSVLFISVLFTLINYFIHPVLFYIWLSLIFSFIFAFIIIVLLKSRNFKSLKVIFRLPVFIFYQVLAMLSQRKVKHSFLKTENTNAIYIEHLLGKMEGENSFTPDKIDNC